MTSLFIFFVTGPLAQAPTCTPAAGGLPDPSCIFETEGGKQISAFAGRPGTEVVAAVVERLLLVAGGLAILALIYSGILYLTAYGDENKAKVAKQNATWAVLGIVVIVLSYAIVNFVAQQKFLGF